MQVREFAVGSLMALVKLESFPRCVEFVTLGSLMSFRHPSRRDGSYQRKKGRWEEREGTQTLQRRSGDVHCWWSACLGSREEGRGEHFLNYQLGI